MISALHLGNDQRTYVCTFLGAHEIPSDDVDEWAHVNAIGAIVRIVSNS
jgi:hypothetical protein